jgi:hypothetical protein
LQALEEEIDDTTQGFVPLYSEPPRVIAAQSPRDLKRLQGVEAVHGTSARLGPPERPRGTCSTHNSLARLLFLEVSFCETVSM